jgi:plastocyanin
MKNKGLIVGAIVLVVIVGVVAAVAMLNSNNANNNTGYQMSNTNTSSTKSSGNAVDSAKAVLTDGVAIKGFAFGPTTITVKVGTKVTWTNQDSVVHTVTADSLSSDAPDSATFEQGKSFSFTFTKAGTYNYHCATHPYMKGTVIVT